MQGYFYSAVCDIHSCLNDWTKADTQSAQSNLSDLVDITSFLNSIYWDITFASHSDCYSFIVMVQIWCTS